MLELDPVWVMDVMSVEVGQVGGSRWILNTLGYRDGRRRAKDDIVCDSSPSDQQERGSSRCRVGDLQPSKRHGGSNNLPLCAKTP
jgi:hypothetical protein